MKKECAIVLNGIKLNTEIIEKYIICADGGYNLLKGKLPDIIIGDLDSIVTLPEGVRYIRFPVEKDKTDGELCIDFAKENLFEEITLYGALDGRIDQMFGNINLLGYCAENSIKAKIADGNVNIYLCSDSLQFKTKIGNTISLIALGGDALVESASQLKYPIKNTLIKLFSSLGISNQTESENFFVKLESGKCLVIEGDYGKIR